MKERDHHDKIAWRLLEEVFGKEETEEQDASNEVIVEKEQQSFYLNEVLVFLLGERESRGNIFQGEESGFDIYMIRANTAERDLLIGFSIIDNLLCISLHRLKETWDDLDRSGYKVIKVIKYGERNFFGLSNILRVGFCIEIKASGVKMRFVQFDVLKRNRNLELYRVYDHGEIFKR